MGAGIAGTHAPGWAGQHLDVFDSISDRVKTVTTQHIVYACRVKTVTTQPILYACRR